jgi:hypothetical protein
MGTTGLTAKVQADYTRWTDEGQTKVTTIIFGLVAACQLHDHGDA